MSFDHSLGRSGFRSFGRGNRIEEFPTLIPVVFNDFRGGYNVSTNRESIDPNSTPNALDMEVSDRNRIVRLPGLSFVEDLDVHTPAQVALHASLDNRSELVFFDPPFIGVKADGVTVWTDIGLTERRVAWTNFGGTLIFGNKFGKTYTRQAGAAAVEESDDVPQASAYATFAGRVFAGGASIDGNLEPMGMRWSAANSNYKDWASLGSGFELLINDMSSGDRIVALKTMGLDFIAIMMRRSIWIGRRTGLVTRPADFQPRVAGIGAVNADTVKSTMFGVLFLSDNGVNLFDGNTATMISEQINADLLPLSYSEDYTSLYDPLNQRYYLMTGNKTFIYDLVRKRWSPSSLVAITGTIFAEQFSVERWNTVGGTWADITETWDEMSPQEAGQIQLMFLGDDLISTTRQLQILNEDSESYFGIGQQARWEFPRANNPIHNRLVTIHQLNLEYAGEGTVDVWTPDNDGVMQFRQSIDLTAAVEPTLYPVYPGTTGKGAGCQLRNPTGRVEVISVQLLLKQRGPRIEQVIP